MTRAMAESWSDYGINANAVTPRFFRIELTGPIFLDDTFAKKHAENTCGDSKGEPSDLDGPLLYFCSGSSNYVTGQTLFIDGGYTAK